MNRKIVIITIALMSILIISSCNDTFEVIVKNDTDRNYTIKSPSFDDVVISSNEEKSLIIKKVILPFRIEIADNENMKTESYVFRDVDHWFSVEHKVLVKIRKTEINIESNGSTRFEREK